MYFYRVKIAFILREDRCLGISESRMLRTMFGVKSEKVQKAGGGAS
jgi:hypothetical protein